MNLADWNTPIPADGERVRIESVRSTTMFMDGDHVRVVNVIDALPEINMEEGFWDGPHEYMGPVDRSMERTCNPLPQRMVFTKGAYHVIAWDRVSGTPTCNCDVSALGQCMLLEIAAGQGYMIYTLETGRRIDIPPTEPDYPRAECKLLPITELPPEARMWRSHYNGVASAAV